jgi:glycosyltransferase involved in cell wall biosynthesis
MMRVCYFGTYRANYIRNRLMIERLRMNGVEVIECHERLWNGMEDRQKVASGGWMSPRFFWRLIKAYSRLAWRALHLDDYDLMIVGYPGQLDVPLARLITWLRHKPLVWDVLMSIHLIALERRLEQQSRLSVRLLHVLEDFACGLPDLLVLDTEPYAAWFEKEYDIPAKRVCLVPLGADDRVYKPSFCERSDAQFVCLYYGTFLASHGLEYVVEAAHLLINEPDIRFEFIGNGPNRDKIHDMAASKGLNNIHFIEWVDEPDLVKRAVSADVLLGTFGTTPQALMTFQNKIHEGLAMAKPVLTGDSPAMRQSLHHCEQIFLCERANPKALADAILILKNDADLRQRLSRQGNQFYKESLDLERTGKILISNLQALLTKW